MANFENDALNAGADAIAALLDGGTLEFQTDTGAEVATITFANPAFSAAEAGVAAATGMTEDSDATGGTVTQFACKQSDGTVVVTGSAGAGGSDDITMASAEVGAGTTVELTEFTVTVGS